jgi:ABC-type dipeptide/oligopeptide/nickel transport system permease component
MTGPADPTAAAAEVIVAPSPPAAVRAAGDSSRKIRRAVGYALPGFALGVLLIVLFAGGTFLDWFPLRGLTSDRSQPVHAYRAGRPAS